MTLTGNSGTDAPQAAGRSECKDLPRDRRIAVLICRGWIWQPINMKLSFLELGFDSLFLTQAAQKIQNKYGVKIAFRQLLDTLGSIRLIAEYLDQQLPQDVAPDVTAATVRTVEEVPVATAAPVVSISAATGRCHSTGDPCRMRRWTARLPHSCSNNCRQSRN